MRRIELFEALVAEDFSVQTAINVVAIHTIHLSMHLKKSDIEVLNGFKDRLTKKARKALWEESDEDFDVAFKLAMAIMAFETSNALQGLGGCVPKTFRELIGE